MNYRQNVPYLAFQACMVFVDWLKEARQRSEEQAGVTCRPEAACTESCSQATDDGWWSEQSYGGKTFTDSLTVSILETNDGLDEAHGRR